MQVLITGIGDAFTTHSFGTSALIDAPEGFVLVDCPDLVHRAVREATERTGWSASTHDVNDVIITHLHGDHCNGLESFGFLRRIRRMQGDDLPHPRLHCTQPVLDRLWPRLAPAMDPPMGTDRLSTLDDYYDVHVLSPEKEATIAGLRVRCRFTGHPIPTIGLLISDDGQTFGWSGDTPFEPAHIDWLNEAYVIVHESNRGRAHTPIEDLNALPREIRKRMRLVHLPDDFDITCTDIAILREGDELELSNRPVQARS